MQFDMPMKEQRIRGYCLTEVVVPYDGAARRTGIMDSMFAQPASACLDVA